MPADLPGHPIRALDTPARHRRGTLFALLAIMLVAAALRLPALDRCPPGLHQDEAVNAWNAYCLLKTGTDQFGVRWPVFYMRELGGNRSVLFLYILLPFQALGGMNVWTSRLPIALAGLATILLLYYVGRRLFGVTTGLTAAALLALNAAHIQMSRFGSEPALTPLLTLLPIAALLWAGLPLSDDEPRPRPVRAILAGLLVGLCCYGYPAARLFLPLFLTLNVLLTWRAWYGLARTRRGAAALTGLLLAVGATFGPLAYEHLTDPQGIGKRGGATWVWSPTDSLPVRAEKVFHRYAAHFGPEFLFRSVDVDAIVWTPGFGLLAWYTLPALFIGLAACTIRLPSTRAARVLLVGVLLYPVGDSLNAHLGQSLQALRSSAGLWPLLLLAALGITHVLTWLLGRRLYAWSLVVAVALAGQVSLETGWFMARELDHARRPPVYLGMQADLLEACQWLRGRLAESDAVICTTRDFNHPWVISLVGLNYDPRNWFAGPRLYERGELWDRWLRYGNWYFANEAERPAVLAALRVERPAGHVIFLLRPDEPAPCAPLRQILGPDGQPTLLIYDCRL